MRIRLEVCKDSATVSRIDLQDHPSEKLPESSILILKAVRGYIEATPFTALVIDLENGGEVSRLDDFLKNLNGNSQPNEKNERYVDNEDENGDYVGAPFAD